MAQPLASPPEALQDDYATVVVGSGYGGSVTAARLAESGQPVCLLERGREWQPGDFPDTLKGLSGNVRIGQALVLRTARWPAPITVDGGGRLALDGEALTLDGFTVATPGLPIPQVNAATALTQTP